MKKKPSPKRPKARKSKVVDLPPRKTDEIKGGMIGIRHPIMVTLR